MNCAICTDQKYDPDLDEYYFCKTCLDDPTLVCIHHPTTNKGYNNVPYGAMVNRYGVYSIKSVIEEGLEFYKDAPMNLKKLQKYKDSWELERQNKIKSDTNRKNIIDTVKLAAEKFSVKLDFTTNTVINMIQNRFNTDGDSDNLTALIISDLDNHANFIKDEVNAKQLIDTRIAKLDFNIDDTIKTFLYLDPDKHSKLVDR